MGGRITHGEVLRIAAPMTLAHMTTPLLGVVATGAIGQTGEPHLIAAVAMGSVIFSFLFWGFGFLRMGTIGLTAQALGAGDAAEVKAVLARALLLAVACGLALVILQGPIAHATFALMAAPADVTAAASVYFSVKIWGAPATFVNYAILGWMIGQGRTTTGLLLQIAINVANMAITIGLVNGLGWGVVGAALGNALAETIGVAAGLAVVWRTLGGRFDVSVANVVDRAKLVRMMAVNRDIMIRTLALVGAFVLFTRQGAQEGATVLAANAILYNLFGLAAYFLDGFATAAEQIGGKAVGARDGQRFRQAVRLTSVWALAFGMVASLVLALAGPFAIALMTTAPEVRAAATAFLPYAALTPVVAVMAFQFDGIFIGATWTAAMRNCMVAALAVFLAAIAILGPFGNHGLWTAFLIFLGARGVFQGLMYPRLARATFG